MHCLKVVLAGEIWSSNLGDGVIAESLYFLLKQVRSEIDVDYLDISGRDTRQASLPKNAKTFSIKRYLRRRRSLVVIRNVLKCFFLQSRYVPSWSSTIAESDAVLIGGGQLLMDNALNFPLKVNLVARLAHSLNKKVFFVSCGVGKDWSWLASQLFVNALMSSDDITVRDTISMKRFKHHIPGAPVSLSSDPALWVSAIYPHEHKTKRNLIGLGVINIGSINKHSDVKVTYDELMRFWVSLARKLHEEGLIFELFTNGSQLDYHFATDVYQSVIKLSIPCKLAPRPTKPHELTECISGYEVVVASRLHAHVIATSYLIPSLALVWDEKVRSFFRDTGREHLVFDNYSNDVIEKIVETILRSKDELVSESVLRDKQSLVLENVHKIISSLN